jgi:hypothetical protein
MRANVYVDGFNLYYGAVKGTPFRWLNLAEMCRQLLPGDEIRRIKYFTALVDNRPHDPDVRLRQETYWRALRTLPNVEIVLGSFLTHEVTLPLAPPHSGFARVLRTQEKGSDVNLATHLLIDAFGNDFDLAVIVSNDSDLALPVQHVAQRLSKPVGLLCPHKHPSVALLPYARFVKHIRKGVLTRCQFPPTLADSEGQFGMPAGW